MLFARLVLLVQALVWGGLGLLYWIRPYEMANLSGMLLMAWNTWVTVRQARPEAMRVAERMA